MPARNRKGLSENTRARIQTTMIVKRLQEHILSKPELIDGEYIQKDLMTSSQVTAALGLLRKTLPDVTQVEGKIEHDHQHKHTVQGVSETLQFLEGVATGESEGPSEEPSEVRPLLPH